MQTLLLLLFGWCAWVLCGQLLVGQILGWWSTSSVWLWCCPLAGQGPVACWLPLVWWSMDRVHWFLWVTWQLLVLWVMWQSSGSFSWCFAGACCWWVHFLLQCILWFFFHPWLSVDAGDTVIVLLCPVITCVCHCLLEHFDQSFELLDIILPYVCCYFSLQYLCQIHCCCDYCICLADCGHCDVPMLGEYCVSNAYTSCVFYPYFIASVVLLECFDIVSIDCVSISCFFDIRFVLQQYRTPHGG